MKKAILFSRVSTTNQDLVQQTNELIAEARNLGYNDYIIIENKESAISLDEEERIGLNELKDAINTNDYDCVICYEISRISRKPKIAYSIRDLFVERKIQLVILKPYFRLLDNNGQLNQTSNLLFALFGSVAESEMMLKKERMKRGKQHKLKFGKYIGGNILFGYAVNKDDDFIINENESEIVKKIFYLYVVENYSQSAISRELIELGLSKNTFAGTQSMVKMILNNPAYCGRENSKSKYKYPAIISGELFDKARYIAMENKTATKHKSSHHWLLNGLLYTRDNKKFYVHKTTNAYIHRYEVDYKIKAYSVNVAIEDIIWDIVKTKYTLIFNDNNEKIIVRLNNDKEIYKSKIQTAVNKRHSLQEKFDKYAEDIIFSNVSDTKKETIVKRFKDEISQIDKQIDKWTSEIEKIEVSIKKYDTFIIPQIREFSATTNEEKQQIINEVVEKIMLMGKRKKQEFEFDIWFKNGDIQTLRYNSRKLKSEGYFLDDTQHRFIFD